MVEATATRQAKVSAKGSARAGPIASKRPKGTLRRTAQPGDFIVIIDIYLRSYEIKNAV